MDEEHHHMDQILPGLWIGDLHSAKDANALRANNIQSILTAMRGRFSLPETFTRHQVTLDDVEEADVLQHLIPAITFIQAELDKGRGILVHCQAGTSRSATIVAAYIMYSQNVDASAAIDLIRKVRSSINPNAGFMAQLEIFHQASFKVSRRDKATRMFYLERAVEEILNGDGSGPETDMFAKWPRRRIRCKMCRTELANREHMLDHGQLGPPTPAVALSPATSRRPSTNDLPSAVPHLQILDGRSSSGPTRPFALTPIDGSGGLSTMAAASLSMSAVDDDDSKSLVKKRPADRPSESTECTATADTAPSPNPTPGTSEAILENPTSATPTTGKGRPPPASSATSAGGGTLHHGADLAAQLQSNPKLAALRSPGGLSMTPMTPLQITPKTIDKSSISPPILMNPKCSGYFVEPMKWMEFFLQDGQLAGKIICPNKKCSAKLGNYDWAGVCCNCKEWVVPGFCIHRSKVDEIV
ncbi:hypothetical protein BGY98DRAFT_1124374 [Russula aff. rugulosa BPL654]|nr:hypothetical protein BGY98DRAFT_1124374 [Russula aff. rugulosa BPL654]